MIIDMGILNEIADPQDETIDGAEDGTEIETETETVGTAETTGTAETFRTFLRVQEPIEEEEAVELLAPLHPNPPQCPLHRIQAPIQPTMIRLLHMLRLSQTMT